MLSSCGNHHDNTSSKEAVGAPSVAVTEKTTAATSNIKRVDFGQGLFIWVRYHPGDGPPPYWVKVYHGASLDAACPIRVTSDFITHLADPSVITKVEVYSDGATATLAGQAAVDAPANGWGKRILKDSGNQDTKLVLRWSETSTTIVISDDPNLPLMPIGD